MTISASLYSVRFESQQTAPCSDSGSCGTSEPSRADRRAERRAERLMSVLDADGDGAVTKDEFTAGAQSLLRQAGARRRAEGHDEDAGSKARGLGRLERRLERVFDRVDANDDGAVDADELKAALSTSRRGSRGRGPAEGPAAEAPSAPSTPAAKAGSSAVSVQVTFVAVAIQRYTATESALPTEKPAPSPHPLPPTDAAAPPHATAPSESDRHA